MSNPFLAALERRNTSRPPVWMMRQAGRYHSHYQNLRKRHSFIELCKNSDLACEVTMGPIEEFDFDAAILFSDILFPLDQLGMNLSYDPKPKLSFYLNSKSDIDRLTSQPGSNPYFSFQREAIEKIRTRLPKNKGMIGFVGGPFTLFSYAVEGSHKGGLLQVRERLREGWFDSFFEKLSPVLFESLREQAQAGPDNMAFFDTCADALTVEEFSNFVAPKLTQIITQFKNVFPSIAVTYYGRNLDPRFWPVLEKVGFNVLGVGPDQNLTQVLAEAPSQWTIQGNFNSTFLTQNTQAFETELRKYFEEICSLPPSHLERWICGLGHGVLPATPMEHVKTFLRLQKEFFSTGK